MADNVTLDSMTGGSVVATDEISGKHHQLVKLEFGEPDNATPVSDTNPLPTTSAKNPLGDYFTHDEAAVEVGASYYGFAKIDGTWYIHKRDTTTSPYSNRYANLSNNTSIANYQAAWTGRASLNYDYLFNLTGI